MLNDNAFHPDWISAPGDTIADILAQRGMSQREFAVKIGRTAEQVQGLLDGREPITESMAEKLVAALGGSSTFWTNRERRFREGIRHLGRLADDIEVTGWLRELPVNDMIKMGWMPRAKDARERVVACLQFFGVSDLRTWRTEYTSLLGSAAFRTSARFESRPAAVAAWLRRGELEGGSIECKAWDVSRFDNAVNQARALTREKDPSRFLPALRALFAACGVAVVILKTPAGCHASGATRFVTRRKAIMMLSFRYLSDDQFWFSVFHEGGHLIRHPHRLFLEERTMPSTKEEEEANTFAVDTLVPPQLRKEMLRLPIDGRAVMRFARKAGVAPGIVVGQLQHLGILHHRQLNNLKRRYVWSDMRLS